MSLTLISLYLFTLLDFLVSVDAQLVNGQYFTCGLAISNAPAPNSEFTVGGTIAVSVDVSGDGRLPQASWGPDTTLPSGFISLSLFLVSDNYNLTIINGTTGDFLRGEPGSTVKHLNYVIPSCLSEGNYDYTYYERSRMNGTEFFAITPIPIHVLNPHGSSGACEANVTNAVQQRPQNDSAPAQNPFTGRLALNTSSPSPIGTTAIPTHSPQSGASTPTQSTGISSPTDNAQVAFDSGLSFPIRRGFSSNAFSILILRTVGSFSVTPLLLLYGTLPVTLYLLF